MDQLVWRKSSRSTTQGGDCIELAALSGGVGVRDSKDPGGGRLAVSRMAFGILACRIKAGELECPSSGELS